MKELDFSQLRVNPLTLFVERWFLLTAGTMENFNTMTVAWGSIGTMWSRPFVQVVVRPSRYTFGFMNKSDTFTLSSFPEERRGDLTICGARSGRDADKLADTSLHAIASDLVAAPSFKEADLVFECRKMYSQDFDPSQFSDEVRKHYESADYHRVFFGEIVRVRADENKFS